MPETSPYDSIVAAAAPPLPPASGDPYDPIVAAASTPSKGRYDDIIDRHATRTGVDPNLIRAVIGQESSGNPRARSPKGAGGLMQLMPGTAARFGVKNVNDPEENIRGGTDYLKFLNDKFKGNTDLMLAGYNAGEGAVIKHGNKIPPYRETQKYVPAVKARYQKLVGYDNVVKAATSPVGDAPRYGVAVNPASNETPNQATSIPANKISADTTPTAPPQLRVPDSENPPERFVADRVAAAGRPADEFTADTNTEDAPLPPFNKTYTGALGQIGDMGPQAQQAYLSFVRSNAPANAPSEAVDKAANNDGLAKTFLQISDFVQKNSKASMKDVNRGLAQIGAEFLKDPSTKGSQLPRALHDAMLSAHYTSEEWQQIPGKLQAQIREHRSETAVARGREKSVKQLQADVQTLGPTVQDWYPDFDYHLRMSPQEFQSLNKQQQRAVVSLVAERVRADQSRRQAGQPVTAPTVEEERALRQKVGLPSRPTGKMDFGFRNPVTGEPLSLKVTKTKDYLPGGSRYRETETPDLRAHVRQQVVAENDRDGSLMFTPYPSPEAVEQEVDRRLNAEKTNIEWAQKNKEKIDEQERQFRAVIRSSGDAGQFKWQTETGFKGTAGLVEKLAGLVKASEYANPVLYGVNAVANKMSGGQVDKARSSAANELRIAATAMTEAAVKEGADRGQVSKFIQNTMAGLISSSPEMVAMSLGVPGWLAFGGGGGLQAAGRGESSQGVLKETVKQGAVGAIFDWSDLIAPVSQTATVRETVSALAKKSAIVGSGTGAVELASGASPKEAAQAAATNVLLPLATRAVHGESKAERPPRETVPEETQVKLKEAEDARTEPIQREGRPADQPHQAGVDVGRTVASGSGTPSLRARGKPAEKAKVAAPEKAVSSDAGVTPSQEVSPAVRGREKPEKKAEDFAITQRDWDDVKRSSTLVSKANPDTLLTTSPSTVREGWTRINYWTHKGISSHIEVPDADVAKTLRQQAYPRGQVIVSVKGGMGDSLPSGSYAGFGFEPYVTGAKGIKAFVGPRESVDWMVERLGSGGYKAEARDVPETIQEKMEIPRETSPQGEVVKSETPQRVIEAAPGDKVGHMFDTPDGSTLMIAGEVTPETLAAKVAAHEAKNSPTGDATVDELKGQASIEPPASAAKAERETADAYYKEKYRYSTLSPLEGEIHEMEYEVVDNMPPWSLPYVKKAAAERGFARDSTEYRDLLQRGIERWYSPEVQEKYGHGQWAWHTNEAPENAGQVLNIEGMSAKHLSTQDVSGESAPSSTGDEPQSWSDVAKEVQKRLKETGPPLTMGSIVYDATKYPKGGLSDHRKIMYALDPVLKKIKSEANKLVAAGTLKAKDLDAYVREKVVKLFETDDFFSTWHQVNKKAAIGIATREATPPTNALRTVRSVVQNVRDYVTIEPTPRLARAGIDAEARQHASARKAVPYVVRDMLAKVFPTEYGDPEAMARTMDALNKDNILDGYDTFIKRRDAALKAGDKAEAEKWGMNAAAIEEKHGIKRLEADVAAAKNDPEIMANINRWKEIVDPELDRLYNEVKRVDPNTEREGRGREFGARVNLLPEFKAEEMRGWADQNKPMPEPSSSNYRNPNVKADQTMRQALFTGDYSTDPHAILTAVLGPRLNESTKINLYNALIAQGAAIELAHGQSGPVMIQGVPAARLAIKVPETDNTGRTTIKERSLWVRRDMVEEIRGVLDTDMKLQPNKVARFLTQIQLAQLTDLTAHLKNIHTVLANAPATSAAWKDAIRRAPVLGTVDAIQRIVRTTAEVHADTPAIRAELASMAKLGLIRPDYPATGIQKVLRGQQLIHSVDTSARVIMNRFFDNMVEAGRVEDTPSNRASFVQQIGEYNERLMSPMMQMARNSGLSPFIVAGRNFNRQAKRMLTGNPGVKASSVTEAAKMRAVNIASGLVAASVLPAMLNVVTTGSMGGRPGTPIGAWDLGRPEDEQGRHRVIDLMQILGIRRGLRATGANAVIEGMRQGQSLDEVAGHARDDVISTAAHPWIGPAAGFTVMAVTGKRVDLRGGPQPSPAQNVGGGGKQTLENMRAALEQQNPTLYGAASFALKPPEGQEDDPYWKRLVKGITKGPAGAAGIYDLKSPLRQQISRLLAGTIPDTVDTPRSELRKEIRAKARAGEDVTDELQAGKNEGILSDADVKRLKKQGKLNSLQAGLEALNREKGLETVLNLFENSATPEEQKQFHQMLARISRNWMRNRHNHRGTAEEKAELRRRLLGAVHQSATNEPVSTPKISGASQYGVQPQ